MCDVAMFGPTKSGWKKEVHNFSQAIPKQELNEISFIGVLKKVIDRVITEEKIINGFRVTGMVPFNINNVDLSKCIGDNFDSSDHAGSSMNNDIIASSNYPLGNLSFNNLSSSSITLDF